MTGLPDVELLQRYRCDRRELLSFILYSNVFKKVVLPPGAVAFEDIDLDQLSVEHVLDCARKGAVLEISDAARKYHDELNLPPTAGTGLGEVYFLVTHPSFSGPTPTRAPPPIATALSPSLTKKFSLRSAPLQHGPIDEEGDEFEDAEEEASEFSTEITRRQLPTSSEVELGLPAFATGLSDDDLRETAYEVLLASVGAAGGLIAPPKEKEEKKSKLARRFSRSKADKSKAPQARATGLAGLMDTMRTQMEVSEADSWRTREALLNASSSRVGKRMDSMLVPLELLSTVSRASFSEKKVQLRWQKRQLNLMEEGLLNHPVVRLDPSGRRAAELNDLIVKLEEAETLPSPAGPAQHAQTLRAIRGVALALSERPAPGDQIGEVCHWADGYHLNVRLYEKLLGSVFDVLEEGRLVDETEEILELLKSTWRVLGITQNVHNTAYTWVLFRQFVMTGEEPLLKHAALHMKKIASDVQCSLQERAYIESLRCTIDGSEVSYVQSCLLPIKQWADKRLADYHLNFSDNPKRMEFIVTMAMVSASLIADDHKSQGGPRTAPPNENAAAARLAKEYIQSSVKLAYERIVEKLDSSSEAQEESQHPLTLLAEGVHNLAESEASTHAPMFSPWHPQSVAIAASLLHGLYRKELKPFLDGVSHFTDDVASVLPAADSLDQYLTELVASVTEEGKENIYLQQLVPYRVEVVAEVLIMRWVNTQLSRVSEWVDRTIQQEKWEPVSTQKRYAGSVVEVFRIVDETTDQFFSLNLPMRLPVLRTLTNGFNSALLLFTNKILAELGDKADLIPPPPTLTRYKRDMALKSTSKKKVVDPRLPDERRSSQINLLSTVGLCVRLNTLHYIATQVDLLEDQIRERWSKKRPQDGLSRNNDEEPNNKRGSGNKSSADELSVVFEGVRKAVDVAIEKICEFTGIKIIFWDTRDTLINGLYKISVSQSRMEKVTGVLDPVLGQLCEIIAEPLRDLVVLGLLQASLDGLLRVLLDGGPTRAFAQSDSDMLDEDLSLLKEFFIADGDGLPKAVVDAAATPVQHILNLYSLETSIVIDSFKRASEQMAAGSSGGQRVGPRVATSADSLLRVLCHRLDREASKFLKKQYNLPKL